MKKYETVKENGQEYFKISPEYSRYLKEKKYLDYLLKSNIPEFYWGIDFKDYEGTESKKEIDYVLQIIENLEEEKFKNVNLYLYSEKKGTQKTAVACNFGKECLKKGYKVSFLLFNDLIKSLLKTQGYNENDSYEGNLKVWYDSDILIIDESFSEESSLLFNSKEANTKIYSELDTFLRKFLYQNKRMVITSNLDMEQVSKKFGDRIQAILDRNFLKLEFKDSVMKKRAERLTIDKLFKEQ